MRLIRPEKLVILRLVRNRSAQRLRRIFAGSNRAEKVDLPVPPETWPQLAIRREANLIAALAKMRSRQSSDKSETGAGGMKQKILRGSVTGAVTGALDQCPMR